MDQFLRTAAERIGIDEHAARDAAAEILIVLRGRMAPVDFGRTLTALPGAAALLAERAPPPTSKGVAGQLQKAASLLGNRAGGTLDATSLARKCGLTSDSIAPFVAAFLEHVEKQTAPELFALIRHRAPELEALSRRA